MDVDFTPVLETLVFGIDETAIPQCTDILITLEDDLEMEETFSVQLTTSEPDVVVLSPSSATVTIDNDDCEGVHLIVIILEDNTYICPFIDVTVSLQRSSYFVNERQTSVIVCTDLLGESHREVLVMVRTIPGSAEGW